ncbi:hypothetical protein GLOIN_2v1868465 [Rhizophagus irregularis DAOM 181602=DAOM 197198]|uniref:Acetyltransferase n=1 Tax=Rhizophagus irregularis (strain DAOM 181602 / DAOM 197198 / MUCL 43194) TaxID=747089 RepID=A0A2P4QTW1_RHIID|nr:hypothetical protein GLOIN_2v1868465 [Rhizophagus irregularis DAOM 181602=DAOM 197198]POG81059.1 hypothetical protein GLOIN_2v1868465 [Rhizophagus irregularis DAOM 181602=DAOM 197198]|eukprot:XP_025187925.1 hypothetical protein GLOIN_2v1868465 [Rhizophagus irregularis DAOM 181602=DAOM 197198]
MSEKNNLNENMLSEKEKALAGLPYSGFSEELINDRFKAREILYKFNNSKPIRFKTDEYLEIGDRVLFGPNVSLYPVSHPIQPEERVNGPELAFPIKIGNDWKKTLLFPTPHEILNNNDYFRY